MKSGISCMDQSEHLFLPYRLSFALKQNGFDEPCFAHYMEGKGFCLIPLDEQNKTNSNWCLAPLYQQVIDWFNDRHNYQIEATAFTAEYMDGKVKYVWEIRKIGEQFECENGDNVEGNEYTYSNSRKECLDKAIEAALKLNLKS